MTKEKTVYWAIKGWGQGLVIIEFWTKPDKSNAIEEKFVKWDDEKVRKRVEIVTGLRNIKLEFVKKK